MLKLLVLKEELPEFIIYNIFELFLPEELNAAFRTFEQGVNDFHFFSDEK